uniref:Uncharacterized protein n=1 Tax=Cacopsylla melanoneura TaxID=428564 RepID=A0A8D9ANJ8_9HEMI
MASDVCAYGSVPVVKGNNHRVKRGEFGIDIWQVVDRIPVQQFSVACEVIRFKVPEVPGCNSFWNKLCGLNIVREIYHIMIRTSNRYLSMSENICRFDRRDKEKIK